MLDPAIREAKEAAASGDARPLLALRDRYARGTDERATLDGLGYLIGVVAERPRLLSGPSEASLLLALIAVIERDAPLLRSALACDPGTDPLLSRSREHWLALEAGSSAALISQIQALEAEAARAHRAELVLEMASLRASASLALGDSRAAVLTARRASRMARTEGILTHEYLANVVLARVRRATGRPHHALRILSALRAVVPAVWNDWVDTEWILSGGEPGETRSERVSAWSRCLRAAHEGERARFERELAGLASDPRSATTRADVAALRCIVDPHFDPAHGPEAAARWRRSETDLAPGGLQACTGSFRGSRSSAYQLLFPNGGATRVLCSGLELLQVPWVEFGKEKRRSGRVPKGLAVLAAAGGAGLTEAELFSRVYGFGFKLELHQNSLRILLHRMRAALGPIAVIERSADAVRMVATTVLALPDERCDDAIVDRLLRVLGSHRTLSAREAAAALGLPLRTIQALLETLSEEGKCLRRGAGRKTEYLVEDTTFREPTAS